MQHFSIAGIQQFLSASYPNIERMIFLIDKTMILYPWVHMIVFSELAVYGPLISNAKPFPCENIKKLQEVAKKYEIWLLPGSQFEKVGEEVFNTACVINPEGEIVTTYQKMFPFKPYEDGVSPGNKIVTFDVPNVATFGISICYDMWIPETVRELTARGAEVILHPSLTPTIDRDIELAIVRSTAVQNQCFIFDVNGVGAGGLGKSIVVGPQGHVLYNAGPTEEIFPLEIDLSHVKHSRERGVLTLGQPLKSFRDSTYNFDLYENKKNGQVPYSWLGTLHKPKKKIKNSTYSNEENMQQVSTLEKNFVPNEPSYKAPPNNYSGHGV